MLFEKINDFAFAIVTETTRAVNTAREMIRDAEIAATAKRTAEKHTNCRACQAGLENFLIQFPDASEEAIQGKHEEIWEKCEACRAEYEDWLCSVYCREKHHTSDGHAHNGDDLRWQNGGVK